MKRTFLIICMALFATISWGQTVPDWKLGVSIKVMEPDLQQTFQYAKKAGIDYLEANMPSFKQVDVATVVQKVADYKRFADQAGMKIWSIHIPYGWDFDLSNPDPVAREQCRQYILFTLEMAKGLGEYRKAVLHTSYEPIEPNQREERIAALREALKELIPTVKEQYGVELTIEDLPRTCLGNSSAEMLKIMEGNPSVNVCFDVNHLLGEKSEHFGQIIGNRIKTVHMSDYDETDERHWLPGRGVINWNGVIDALIKNGYEGPFLFEVNKTPWNGEMEKFCKDLAGSWQKIKNDYIDYSQSSGAAQKREASEVVKALSCR